MANIDIQAELKAVTEQISKMVEELNKISTTRDQMIQQLQNINGVAMYLRGKLPPEERPEQDQEFEMVTEEKNIDENSEEKDDMSRSVEYP